MKQVGIISVTLNAVNPLMKYLRENNNGDEGFKVLNYLDEGLQELVQKEGRITEKCITRMVNLIYNAVDDGADVILLSCTVFSPYVERLKNLFSIPITSADIAMLEQAVKLNKKTAILCTFPVTVETSTKLFRAAQDRIGIKNEMEIFLLTEAADAIKIGDKVAHDQIIADKANSLSTEYELIVLAQISMAEASKLLDKCSIPVLTSPQSAIIALKEVLFHNQT
ncbi:hypothetical protein FACS1894187_12650 [Synergistales bacterium]|nr:hypothetical protein FACS1894187_12650 [Synergistales bacterium]